MIHAFKTRQVSDDGEEVYYYIWGSKYSYSWTLLESPIAI